MKETISLSVGAFGGRPNTGLDSTTIVRRAFEAAVASGKKRIEFEPGRYDFWPDRATEQFLFISNNDEGLKRILFPLIDLDGFEIDGQGAEFVFHGLVLPFALMRSKGIHLTNFTVDWHRPFHTEAEVLRVEQSREGSEIIVDLRIPEQYPYVVTQHQLYFTDDAGSKKKPANSLEFDPKKQETAFKVFDSWSHKEYHYAEELDRGTVRFTSDFGTVPTVGNTLVLVHTDRDCPGIFMSDCSDIRVSDVTVYHTPAMALIAQRTCGIKVERFAVTPNTQKGRLVSATADATHFVNCSGLIELIDCHFQGQMDDATNVHGIYARISQIVSETEIEIELAHGQQQGVHITHAGDRLEFIRQKTLTCYHVAPVAGTTVLNKRFCTVKLASPIPNDVRIGDAVASLTWMPDLTIRNCRSLKNRARGFLISSAGKVLIEDNYFHVPGSSILFAGDAKDWFESGSVRDVTIRGNHFDNCNYGVWGEGVLTYTPEIKPEFRDNVYYHSGICIEGNTFDVFDDRLVVGHNVENLVFRNNEIRHSSEYPKPKDHEEMFDLSHSREVLVQTAPTMTRPEKVVSVVP